MIEKDKFLEIIDLTPLISIDFVITNEKKEMLFGLRNNEPSKGMWFVPGGRIRKGERIQDAFHRILEMELGINYDFDRAKHHGLYEHFYDTNLYSEPNISTHYVVNAFHLFINSGTQLKTDDQHDQLKWVSIADVESYEMIHRYSKDYIKNFS